MLKCKAEMTRTVLPENSCTECCSCIYVKLPQYQLSCGEDSCLNVGAFDRTADVQLLPQFLCSGFVTIPLSPCRGKKVRFFFLHSADPEQFREEFVRWFSCSPPCCLVYSGNVTPVIGWGFAKCHAPPRK